MSTTPSPLPLILPGIQTFPPEMILEILELLDPAEAIRAATACRQWHRAAIGKTAYWLRVCINETDIEDHDVLQRVLQRSRGRPISLHLNFPSRDTAGTIIDALNLLTFLWNVVRGHLHRCTLLEVHAHQKAWRWIHFACTGQTFPLMHTVVLHNRDIPACWEAEDSLSVPPIDIFFPLPRGHQLENAILQGVSLGYTFPFSNLQSLNISHHFPDLVLDGRLNPCLFASTTTLSFAGMCVPAMPPTVGTPAPQPDSPMQTLVLRNLQAMPSDIVDANDLDSECDCAPFFAALPTAHLLNLFIESWDLNGRIWDDFIASFPIATAKFPLVEELVLSSMDFQWMPYTTVAFFFAAFPALQRLILHDCLWEEIIETLEVWPTLCPSLPQLTVDNLVILRDDELPFRNYMLEHELPVGDEDSPDDEYYHDL
ncbi:hypothetical protein B0H11DRAFT_2046043 [Mycena galericulata]|nr:hypothetical protein B0H11DRAFT_2046043 [Mycena galericulata]